MELYQRIKERRIELDMSQEELAFKLGYKSRSSINKIEMGDNDIPQSKILAFANALNTTPSYLLGLDDKANSTDKAVDKLDMDTLRKLNDTNITRVNTYAQNLLNVQMMEDEPVLIAAHNDNPNEEQQALIREDLKSLKKPD